MAKELVFKSTLAPFIEGFIAEKRANGFKYSSQAVQRHLWFEKKGIYGLRKRYLWFEKKAFMV